MKTGEGIAGGRPTTQGDEFRTKSYPRFSLFISCEVVRDSTRLFLFEAGLPGVRVGYWAGPKRGLVTFIKRKVYIISLNFHESSFFLSQLQNQIKHIPQLLKPFILPLGSAISGFVFSFLFILAESLKNHSKSQKNHKMENLILLDST